jgi:hypothetical protein
MPPYLHDFPARARMADTTLKTLWNASSCFRLASLLWRLRRAAAIETDLFPNPGRCCAGTAKWNPTCFMRCVPFAKGSRVRRQLRSPGVTGEPLWRGRARERGRGRSNARHAVDPFRRQSGPSANPCIPAPSQSRQRRIRTSQPIPGGAVATDGTNRFHSAVCQAEI